MPVTHPEGCPDAWLNYGQGGSIIKCLMTLQLFSIIPVQQRFQKIIREIWQATETVLVNWIH